MCSLGGPQIRLLGNIFDTNALHFQTFEKLCESILLPCNSKGLIFDFYLHVNRKRNKCSLAAYSFKAIHMAVFRSKRFFSDL